MSYIEEYRKERKRARDYLSRLRRSGYDVETKLPPIPKKITQGSINRLKKIDKNTVKKKKSNSANKSENAKSLKDQMQQEFDKRQREIEKEYETAKRREQIRKEASERIFNPDNVTYEEALIRGYKYYLSMYPNKVATRLLDIVEMYIGLYGKSVFSKFVEENEDSAKRILSGIHGQSDDDIENWSYEMGRKLEELVGLVTSGEDDLAEV